MMLLVAEIHKTIRRPFDIVLTLTVIGLSVLTPAVVMVRALRDPGQAAMHAIQLIWPISVDRAALVLVLMGLVGAPMLAASAIGNEHDTRTWATLVSRRASRYPLLLTKVIVVLGTVAVVTILAVMTTAITARLAVAAIDIAPDPLVLARQTARSPWPAVALAIADAWWSALMAVAAAVLLRSTLAAALLGILIPQLLRFVVSAETAFMNPAAHFMNLQYAAGVVRVAPPYEVGVGVWGSGVVIVVYGVAVTAAIAYWFEKRDIPVG